ncbi:MAG: D-2-hydroxyacid dehydrogenase [Oscillospiraceae bacterium]|jgi:phosphoglycerate dehydrogenase-like enzyme|nr:D-2-hydroxyacid dehydrogenase [Oscillospiraceae bacterium]
MPQYIALRGLPFTPDQSAALSTIIKDGGYEPLTIDESDPGGAFPWNDCAAMLGIITSELIPRMPNARWFQMSWAGAESLVGADYPNPETILTNASGAYGFAIAEYMLGGALMLRHNLHTYARIQERREWTRRGVTRGLYRCTVVVVGLGDIGRRFALYAKALGAAVLGVRRSPGEPPEGVDELIPYARLTDELPRADVVAVCLPATRETAGLFNASHIGAMKPEAVFINAGRGSTVDEAALTRALQSGAIAGAMLDVTAVEPLPLDSPLWSLDNVVITPHVSGRVDDPTNVTLIYDIFEDNLRRFCAGQPLRHVVDRKLGY